MRRRWAMFALAAVACLWSAGRASAHHGTAGYNIKEAVTVMGTVTDFQFLNPHSLVYFDVKNDKGAVEKWQGELTSPNRLVRAGWNKNSVKAGDKVTVTGWRSTGGANSLWITKLLVNGEELNLGAGD